MRLLVVEDNEQLAKLLAKGLQTAGYDTDVFGTVAEARTALLMLDYAAVILDLGLPDGDGLAVLRELRHRKDSVPVLVLTARGGLQDRISGLRSGADDYLVKPFAFAELMARVQALLRRPTRRVEPLRFDGLDIDLLHRRVLAHGRHLDLTRVEFDILLALAEARGDAVTRRDLLATVWGYRFEPGTNVIDVHVARLRRKLESVGAASAIRTVRGIGYALGA